MMEKCGVFRVQHLIPKADVIFGVVLKTYQYHIPCRRAKFADFEIHGALHCHLRRPLSAPRACSLPNWRLGLADQETRY